MPITRAELDALVFKRSELNSQLSGLTDRRQELASQRQRMGREEGQEHDVRIRVIDERSARIEQEILQADEAIAGAIANGVTVTAGGAGGAGGQGGAATTTVPESEQLARAVRNAAEDSVFSATMLSATLLVAAVLLWRGVRRLFRKKTPLKPDAAAPLHQLQQSIDVIAVEVERIAGAQRYMAKRMDERLAILGAGEAQPVSHQERERVPVRGEDRR